MAQTDFLAEDWFAAVLKAAQMLPGMEGMSAVVNFELQGDKPSEEEPVSKQRPAKLHCHAVLRDGRLEEFASGKSAETNCSVSCKLSEALAILLGEDDIEIAYMQGRLKLGGDYGILLFDMRDLYAQPQWKEFVVLVRGLTTG